MNIVKENNWLARVGHGAKDPTGIIAAERESAE